MSLKLKVLGLGLLAIMAMGAVAAMNAGATVSGHFTSSVETTTITGVESGLHKTELSAPTLSKDKIHCNIATYHGHVTGKTFTTITITPHYTECTTTESKAVVHVNMNECDYTFHSVTPQVPVTHATVTLMCPPGKKVKVTDTGTGCVLDFGEQTLKAAVYDTDTTAGKKHSLTVTITATGIKFEAHSGICVFVGTNQAGGELSGSVTVFGEEPGGGEVDITAT